MNIEKAKRMVEAKVARFKIGPQVDSETARFTAWLMVEDPTLCAKANSDNLGKIETARILIQVTKKYKEFRGSKNGG